MARQPKAPKDKKSDADRRVEAAARKLGFLTRLPPEDEHDNNLSDHTSSGSSSLSEEQEPQQERALEQHQREPELEKPNSSPPAEYETAPEFTLSAGPASPAQQKSAKPGTGKKGAAKKPHYIGHRQRLRERFAAGGGNALADYELLEMLLFRALPRRDTKPIAKELIERFGSFAEVVNAPESELRKIKYIKDAAINEFNLMRAATERLLKGELAKQPLLSSWASVLDHCRAAMAYEPREQFRVLFLDKRNRLIRDEVQQTGTVDHTPVYVREVCRRALELNATAIILAHNHPSGDPTPSRGDIEMTKEVARVAKGLGITVHDHIIIAREGHASFRGLGLI